MPECIEFGTWLTGEMHLRGLTVRNKTVGQMRNKIIQCLEAKNEMQKLLVQIDENKLRKGSMVRIMAFIPCIMRMETRNEIKILTLALIEGLFSLQGGRLHPAEYNECNTAKQREEKYISKIQDIINKTVIGSNDCPAQWKLPEKNPRCATTVGMISMENYKVREILKFSHQIIDASISDADRQQNGRRV